MVVPTEAVSAAQKQSPLLRGLIVIGAGFAESPAFHINGSCRNSRQVTAVFCTKGRGWWETQGVLKPIRKGDFLVIPGSHAYSCAPQASNSWTVHWVQARGDHVPSYLRELGLPTQTPVLCVGEDPQVTRLFNEILHSLQRGTGFTDLLHASHGLAYLFSHLVQRRRAEAPQGSDASQRAAQAIIYMSEHLDQTLRVSDLARLAGLSAAHFGEVFKRHAGCSPRDYLHLLRIHEACRLLRGSTLSVKEIAARLGYGDPLYFSRHFKAFQGISPSQYRQTTAST